MMRAVVLAAGAGLRMGGPKALVHVGAHPLAVAHAVSLLAAGVRTVAVVLRAEVAAVLAPLWPDASRVTVVVSNKPDAWGPAGSLQALVEAVDVKDGLWGVTPVDALPVREATLAALRNAVQTSAESLAARPVYNGRGGHPVVLRGAVLAAFASPGEPRNLREVLAGLGEAVLRVAVDDPTVTADLDTPEDLARWLGVGRAHWTSVM